MMETTALIAALREAGHTETAEHLRDRELAAALRERGRDDLATALEGKVTVFADSETDDLSGVELLRAAYAKQGGQDAA